MKDRREKRGAIKASGGWIRMSCQLGSLQRIPSWFKSKVLIMKLENSASFPFSFHLVHCGQVLAVSGEGDQAGGQVDQAADLQVRGGAAGGRRADAVPCTHHVTVAPLDTAGKTHHASNLDPERHIFWSACVGLLFDLDFDLVNTSLLAKKNGKWDG